MIRPWSTMATRSQSCSASSMSWGVVRERGAALPLPVLDQVPELPPRLRVEPGGRLVEEEELGIGHQRAGERQPLLLAAGELADPGVALLAELHRGEHVVDGTGTAVEAPEELDRLRHGELLGELGLLERDPEALAERARIPPPGLSEHPDLPRVGRGEAFADLDGGGLAGAVGPEEAEALARPDLEVEAVHGDDIAVLLAEAAEDQGGRGGRAGHPRSIARPDASRLGGAGPATRAASCRSASSRSVKSSRDSISESRCCRSSITPSRSASAASRRSTSSREARSRRGIRLRSGGYRSQRRQPPKTARITELTHIIRTKKPIQPKGNPLMLIPSPIPSRCRPRRA